MLALVDAFEELGNPFLEDKGELVELDGSTVMDQESINNVKNVKAIGSERYTDFLDKRISSQEEPFTGTIHQANLHIFKEPSRRPRQKSLATQAKEQQLKTSHILMASHAGREITEELFSHESSDNPPSLTQKGVMHHGSKSEILDCISVGDKIQQGPNTTANIIDGALMVHTFRPVRSATVEEYINDVIITYLLRVLIKHQRVDIVWDIYILISLKAAARDKRGTGKPRQVKPSTKIPSNWAEFLRVDRNKQALFVEIARKLKAITLPEVNIINKNYYTQTIK